MKLRIYGVLLFLFIPIVLYLYLAFPLKVLPSLIAGVIIMFGHRFIARPFMMHNLDKRDFWDGSVIKGKPEKFKLQDGKDIIGVRFNSKKNKEKATRFFNFLYKFRFIIKPAILGTVFVYLILAIITEATDLAISIDLLVMLFKLIIAVTVVLVSLLYRYGSVEGEVKSIFPSHNLFLLGINWTLWIFRIVGLWWIVQGAIDIFS